MLLENSQVRSSVYSEGLWLFFAEGRDQRWIMGKGLWNEMTIEVAWGQGPKNVKKTFAVTLLNGRVSSVRQGLISPFLGHLTLTPTVPPEVRSGGQSWASSVTYYCHSLSNYLTPGTMETTDLAQIRQGLDLYLNNRNVTISVCTEVCVYLLPSLWVYFRFQLCWCVFMACSSMSLCVLACLCVNVFKLKGLGL